ncbi:MAG TPA: choloylglycine hydrolase family protein [Candidatus Omnitrophota bacterium]|nr:choloylglycine hydrolase family protein [Candidatus Omnitrophota bacterium]
MMRINTKIFKFAIVLCMVFLNLSLTGEACTSFVLKATDGSPVYGRTCEWGVFDLRSDLVLVPRDFAQVSKLDNGSDGLSWRTKYGYVAINAAGMPYYLDGMNETGLTVGGLYLPGYAKFQEIEKGKENITINSAELEGYILGQFASVAEIKEALPNLLVVENSEITAKFGAPLPLHFIVTDNTGSSIVIEYVAGELKIYDNEVGVMTNSPGYDWHIQNLRNYTQLAPYAPGPGKTQVEGVNFTPFGAGAGMTGLPGDYSPASRFVRAFFYTQTSIPLENSAAAISQAEKILDNFDYPKGIVREGESADKYFMNFTTWTVIGDIKNKRYYWWTEWNRRMRMVDLSKLDFGGTKTVAIPLDNERVESIDDRTNDFQY